MKPPNQRDMERLRRLHAEASPWPWLKTWADLPGSNAMKSEQVTCMCDGSTLDEHGNVAGVTIASRVVDAGSVEQAQANRDMKFIVAAHDMVPSLLELIAEQAAKIKEMESHANQHEHHLPAMPPRRSDRRPVPPLVGSMENRAVPGLPGVRACDPDRGVGADLPTTARAPVLP